MLVFGAIDHVAALARIATFLGYRVTVCDARATFATLDRFPHAAAAIHHGDPLPDALRPGSPLAHDVGITHVLSSSQESR